MQGKKTYNFKFWFKTGKISCKKIRFLESERPLELREVYVRTKTGLTTFIFLNEIKFTRNHLYSCTTSLKGEKSFISIEIKKTS